MKRIPSYISAFGSLALLALAGCDPTGAPGLPDLAGGNADGDQFVGDATAGDGDTPSAAPNPQALVRARVRNESSTTADVTLRFVRESKIVHLAFVRVLPDTITTVTSPESAETVELSGVDDRGLAIHSAVFVFGIDFSEAEPAEYTLRDDIEAAPDPVDPAPLDPLSPSPSPPQVALIEPSGPLTVSLGATFLSEWTDTGGSAGAVVSLFMQPVGSTRASDRVSVGPAIGSALDGVNDAFQVVVQDLEPGLYKVVAVMEDGTRTSTSTAPGRVQVVRDPGNTAPSLNILGPVAAVALRDGELLSVSWDDADPDNNATVTFELASSDRSDASAHVLALGPPIAENPDGASADSATFVVRGALPGLYDLLATIDDGQLIGTDLVERVVRILPDRDNDPPQLTLIEPAADTGVVVGQSIRVQWLDSDANDDARIALLLDPDLDNSPLDGDELLLAASLGEDADGSGDVITLGISPDTPHGTYRLVGLISDGLTQLQTRAPGIVTVGPNDPPGSANDNDVPDEPDSEEIDSDGNIIIHVPPPPPPDPTIVTPIEGVEEIEAVVVTPTEQLTVYLESTLEDGADRTFGRIYLSNLAYGGRLRADATPGGPVSPVDGDDLTLIAPLRLDVVPNSAWPRKFDVEVETFVDGSIELVVGSTPVWIMQEVEVVGAVLSGGASCIPPDVSASPPIELKLTWYGGGVQDTGRQADVQFWLSLDGSVSSAPGDGLHRVVAQMPASPNFVHTTTIDLTAALSPLPPLSPGDYSIVTVTDPRGARPMVSAPSITAVTVCAP